MPRILCQATRCTTRRTYLIPAPTGLTLRCLEPLYVGEESGTGPYLSLEGSFGPLR